MLRIAPDVLIWTMNGDAIVDRPADPQLLLSGKATEIQILVELATLGLTEETLRKVIGSKTGGGELIDRLLEERVLLNVDLADHLLELHGRMMRGTSVPLESPVSDATRALKDIAGPGVVIDLPAPEVIAIGLEDALGRRRSARHFVKEPLRLADLSTLLALGAGGGPRMRVSAPLPQVLGGPPAARTYPSGGALYPVETVVYPLSVDSLGHGFYLYQPLGHSLLRLPGSQSPDQMAALLDDQMSLDATLCILFVTDFGRPSLTKYGVAAYRLMLLEAGHLAQNLLLVGAALGLGGLPLSGFYSEDLSRGAGLATAQHSVIYALVLGFPAEPMTSDVSGSK